MKTARKRTMKGGGCGCAVPRLFQARGGACGSCEIGGMRGGGSCGIVEGFNACPMQGGRRRNHKTKKAHKKSHKKTHKKH